jgi:hypothetical protein
VLMKILNGPFAAKPGFFHLHFWDLSGWSFD